MIACYMHAFQESIQMFFSLNQINVLSPTLSTLYKLQIYSLWGCWCNLTQKMFIKYFYVDLNYGTDYTDKLIIWIIVIARIQELVYGKIKIVWSWSRIIWIIIKLIYIFIYYYFSKIYELGNYYSKSLKIVYDEVLP